MGTVSDLTVTDESLETVCKSELLCDLVIHLPELKMWSTGCRNSPPACARCRGRMKRGADCRTAPFPLSLRGTFLQIHVKTRERTTKPSGLRYFDISILAGLAKLLEIKYKLFMKKQYYLHYQTYFLFAGNFLKIRLWVATHKGGFCQTSQDVRLNRGSFSHSMPTASLAPQTAQQEPTGATSCS